MSINQLKQELRENILEEEPNLNPIELAKEVNENFEFNLQESKNIKFLIEKNGFEVISSVKIDNGDHTYRITIRVNKSVVPKLQEILSKFRNVVIEKYDNEILVVLVPHFSYCYSALIRDRATIRHNQYIDFINNNPSYSYGRKSKKRKSKKSKKSKSKKSKSKC